MKMNFSKAELMKLPYKVNYEEAIKVMKIELPLNEEIVDPKFLSPYKDKKILISMIESMDNYTIVQCSAIGDGKTIEENRSMIRRAEVHLCHKLKKNHFYNFAWLHQKAEIESFPFDEVLYGIRVKIEIPPVVHYIDMICNFHDRVLIAETDAVRNETLAMLKDGRYEVDGKRFATLNEAYEAFKVNISAARLRNLFDVHGGEKR
jgi:hypothetical protein